MQLSSGRAALIVAFGLILLPAQVQASTISYPDFSSSAGLTLNGSATTTTNVLRLTNGGINQAGSAWVNALQDVALGFDTTFQFRITPGFAFNGEFADGLTFTIQNGPVSPLNALGSAGDGIGYGGISNAVVIEFDIFCNSPLPGCYDSGNGINDPNGNHISVISAGAGQAAIQLQSNSLGTALVANPMDDGLVHTARVVYAAGPQTLTVYLDSAPMIVVPGFNLATRINLSGGQAYLGFTSGTGGGTATHDILNWTSVAGSPSTAVPEPGTLLLLGTGVLLVGLRARRGRA